MLSRWKCHDGSWENDEAHQANRGRGRAGGAGISHHIAEPVCHTATHCRGMVVSASFNKPIAIVADLGAGTVAVDFALLMVNLLGGHCLYEGTLTGAPGGTDPSQFPARWRLTQR